MVNKAAGCFMGAGALILFALPLSALRSERERWGPSTLEALENCHEHLLS